MKAKRPRDREENSRRVPDVAPARRLARAAMTCNQHARGTQKSVAITIYNVNLGLWCVTAARSRKRRSSSEGVAQQINPATVHIKSLTSPDALSVVEQNYEYGLALAREVARQIRWKVTLVLCRHLRIRAEVPQNKPRHFARKQQRRKGLQIGGSDSDQSLQHLGHSLSAIARKPYRPSDSCACFQATAPLLPVEASYLTGGINWKADYVVLVNSDETRADVTGWVTIDNKSGAEYPTPS